VVKQTNIYGVSLSKFEMYRSSSNNIKLDVE